MMDNNKEQATQVAFNEKGRNTNSEEAKKLSGAAHTATRSFGLVDLWRIGRNARTFRIHNRIPRL